MGHAKTTQESMENKGAFGFIAGTPGLLLAHFPRGAASVDRCAISPPFSIGRQEDNALCVQDEKISGIHCQITKDQRGYWLEDLRSTNGTFLDGEQVYGPKPLEDVSVIRIGATVLVFHTTANLLLAPSPSERFDLLGPFHADPLVQQLKEAARSKRHLLLAGPSGVGKELAARTVAAIAGNGGPPLKLTAHNAARFASEDEATTTLFGVGAQAFTNVESHPGLIEHAANGVLFLDDIHNLPSRVQRSLLRVMEDGIFSRIGETTDRSASVRFIFASNAPAPSYGLAPDLLARLRVVPIPTLRERTADIPHIFKAVLEQALKRCEIDADTVIPLLGGDHFEAICLDGFVTDNVRGLIDLADRIATRIDTGQLPQDAVLTVFAERFNDGPVARRYHKCEEDRSGNSHYEQHREIITAVFRECRGNLSATERSLKARGIKCTRRRLGIFAEKWGLRTPRNS